MKTFRFRTATSTANQIPGLRHIFSYTVISRLRQAGFQARRPAQRNGLTTHYPTERPRSCQEHIRLGQWNTVIFSDESRFMLFCVSSNSPWWSYCLGTILQHHVFFTNWRHFQHESAENFYSKTTFMSYHDQQDRQIYPEQNTSGTSWIVEIAIGILRHKPTGTVLGFTNEW